MRAPVPIFLILALFLLLPARAALPQPLSSPSTDPARAVALDQGKAEAASLLKKGEAAKAYELYLRLLLLTPEDDELNLGLARAGAGAKRWNQAVMAYEALLEKHPREAGLYGELAHVYMLLGDREAAERCLAMVRTLDGQSSRADTDKALDTLESRYSDFKVHGKVRMGFQYDSNANLGPPSDDLTLGNWRLKVNGAKAKESFGAYVGADLDLGKRFYRDSPWWLVGDLRGFWRGHANSEMSKTNSRESQWGRAAAGLRHVGSSTMAELRLKGEVFDNEFTRNVTAWGPEGTLLWAVVPSFHLILKGGLEKRTYYPDCQRDGLFGSAGLYGRAFFGADNHEFLLGGRYMSASAEKKDYGYEGWEGTASLMFKLPHGFEAGPSFSYTEEKYRGPATALEAKKRRDERLRTGLGLTYRIDESWSVECGYNYTRNRSNSGLYNYDQHFMNTGIVWSF